MKKYAASYKSTTETSRLNSMCLGIGYI